MATQEKITIVVGDRFVSPWNLENPEWRREKLLEVLGGKEKLIPRDPTDQEFLLEVYRYRCLCEQVGNDSPLKDFPKLYRETDPTRVERLNAQLKIIHSKTPLPSRRVDTVSPNTLAVNGEFSLGEIQELVGGMDKYS